MDRITISAPLSSRGETPMRQFPIRLKQPTWLFECLNSAAFGRMFGGGPKCRKDAE